MDVFLTMVAFHTLHYIIMNFIF